MVANVNPQQQGRQMDKHEINNNMHRLLWSENQDIFDWDKPLPLAIGFRDEVNAMYPELDEKHVKQFLSWWTSRLEYLNSMLTSYSRYHLNGRQSRRVTEEERQSAARRIEARKNKSKRVRSKA